LTALVLSSLKSTARAYYVSDDQQAGLRVRVAPAGTITWNVAYRIKGEATVKSASLGVCDPSGRAGLSLAEARERTAEILKAARQGRDLLAEEKRERHDRKSRLSIDDLISDYATSIKSGNRKGGPLRTANEIERRLRRALSAKLPEAAADLTRADVSRLMDAVADRHPREAEKRRQVIGAMFRWGVAKGYVSADPTAGTEGYGRGDPRDRVLSPDEIEKFWRWLDAGADNMPPDCIAVLRLQLCLGARVGEIAGCCASEFDREGARLIWTLPAARSKNKQQRTTPIVGRAKGIIEQALSHRPSGPLFRASTVDRALTSSDLGNALKHRDLPCAHFTTHDLRRTVVSAMDEMGIALDTIAAVVGHQRGSRDTRTLIRHYSRPRLDERIEVALSSWDARLTHILLGGQQNTSENVVALHAYA
jgi:integrase